jgi:hypothetical protein
MSKNSDYPMRSVSHILMGDVNGFFLKRIRITIKIRITKGKGIGGGLLLFAVHLKLFGLVGGLDLNARKQSRKGSNPALGSIFNVLMHKGLTCTGRG